MSTRPPPLLTMGKDCDDDKWQSLSEFTGGRGQTLAGSKFRNGRNGSNTIYKGNMGHFRGRGRGRGGLNQNKGRGHEMHRNNFSQDIVGAGAHGGFSHKLERKSSDYNRDFNPDIEGRVRDGFKEKPRHSEESSVYRRKNKQNYKLTLDDTSKSSDRESSCSTSTCSTRSDKSNSRSSSPDPRSGLFDNELDKNNHGSRRRGAFFHELKTVRAVDNPKRQNYCKLPEKHYNWLPTDNNSASSLSSSEDEISKKHSKRSSVFDDRMKSKSYGAKKEILQDPQILEYLRQRVQSKELQFSTIVDNDVDSKKSDKDYLQTRIKEKKFPVPKSAHVWQFEDERGNWITYGQQINVRRHSFATLTTSDDIEKYFTSSGDQPPQPLVIKSGRYTYTLDFQQMDQINNQTSTRRKIRRITQSEARNVVKNNRVVKKKCLQPDADLQSKFPANIWQFLDETGSWIPFGEFNTIQNDDTYATVETSVEIEKHFVANTSQSLKVSSEQHQYTLDFQKMIQTNDKSGVHRPIRQIAVCSDSKQPRYEWFFMGECKSWVKYGCTSSHSSNEKFATQQNSDDIESAYIQDNQKPFRVQSGQFTYELDFSSMTQTNISTSVVRMIKREPVKVSKMKCFPSNWQTMSASESVIKVRLTSNDQEYQDMEKLVKLTLPNCNISSLYRIQNKVLWASYHRRRRHLKTSFRSLTLQEKLLFHGTNSNNICAICEENLDWRLHGTNQGNMYGRGTYFSNSAQYSSSYSNSSPKVMFIVKVLIGQYVIGNANIIKPPKDSNGIPFDTTVDNTQNPSIFVKYESSEYYPLYYFEFT